ncbi:MAG TPA: hypothetical protein VE377_13200 [Candidatus Dormibacteraeota bacterium]|nr:hypothetical protein [Candidatus Dormibacteraeota bacterium]
MQFAKDSFFLALQQRLAGLNPARTVTLNGTTVPAVVVVENLPPTTADPMLNTFYIEWGKAEVVRGHTGTAPLIGLDVFISYYTLGTVASMVDRGRLLAQLDDELLSICQPPNAGKQDYTQSPSMDLGTSVFWAQPSFGEGKGSGMFRERIAGATEDQYDARLQRNVKLTMYFFPEVTLS